METQQQSDSEVSSVIHSDSTVDDSESVEIIINQPEDIDNSSNDGYFKNDDLTLKMDRLENEYEIIKSDTSFKDPNGIMNSFDKINHGSELGSVA